MQGIIVNMSRHTDGFASMSDFNGENPEYIGALMGHYDYFEMLSCERMAHFFFAEQVNSKLHQPDKHDFEMQKVHLFSFDEDIEDISEDSPGREPADAHNGSRALPSDARNGSRALSSDAHYAAKSLSLLDSVDCVLTGERFIPSFIMLTLFETQYKATLPFYELANDIVEQTGLLCSTRDKIVELANDVYKQNTDLRLCVKPMYSMSHNEIAVLWYTNHVEAPGWIIAKMRDIIVEVSSITAQQKMKKLPLFRGSRTLVAITQEAGKNPIIGSGAKLRISVSYKEAGKSDVFITSLCNRLKMKRAEVEFEDRYGNHDALLVLPLNDKSIKLYLENSAGKSNPFVKYCSQTHTRVMIPQNNHTYTTQTTISVPVTTERYDQIVALNDLSPNDSPAVEETYKKLIGKSPEKEAGTAPDKKAEFFNRNLFLKDTLHYLYMDYFRCRQTMTNSVWAKDLEEQFVSVMNAIDLLIDRIHDERGANMQRRDNEKHIREINDLVIAMQQIHGQISQGSKLFYEAPGSNLPYSSPFRSVTWAYNGILKTILAIIYSTRRDTHQERITPILTFGMTPVIKVDRYETYRGEKRNKEVLLVYRLPVAALYNMIPYIYFLLHESHHHSAPTSRYVRNKVIASELVCNAITQFLFDDPNDKTDPAQNASISGYGARTYDVMSAEFLMAYEGVMHELLQAGSTQDDPVPGLDAPSSVFEKTLWRGLMRLRDYRPVGEKTAQLLTTVKNKCGLPGVPEAIDGFLSRDTGRSNNEEITRRIYDYVESINEACCDLFMIQCSRMSEYRYLDFICDYMYTTMKPVDVSPNDIPKNYTLRIGMVIDYFVFKDVDANLNVNLGDEKCDRIINGWAAYNAGLKAKREQEGRETSKVDFRLSMVLCIKEVLQKYRVVTANRELLQVLIRIGVFEEILDNLFAAQRGEAAKALQKEAILFKQNVMVIQKISREYMEIQEQGNLSKKQREHGIMRLVLKAVQHFSGQTRSWSDIWQESEQRKKGYSNWNKCIIPEEVRGGGIRPVSRRKPDILRPIYTFEEFIPAFNSLARELQRQNPQEILWYRGVSSQKHGQIPSMYRMYDVDKLLDGDSGRLQNIWLNEFEARASSSGDIDLAQVASTADWLAVMQHYNSKTHFLDWSEQLFGAMYFMLEPIILSKHDRRNTDAAARAARTRAEGAALYILAPSTLNEVWMQNVSSHLDGKAVHNYSEKCALLGYETMKKYSGYIPNLSRKDNADLFSTHLLGLEGCAQCPDNMECPMHLPLAIQTNRSNKRISAQAGTFVAFSANAYGYPKEYDLIKVQEKWLNDGICENPFIYKLVIHKSAMDDLADWLITAGMRTFRFYPDLEYIGKGIQQNLPNGRQPLK